MGIFGLIFIILPIIILFVLLSLGATLIRNLLRMFGIGRGFNRFYGTGSSQDNAHRHSNTQNNSQEPTAPSKTKKVIADDEGEYVDFEEVK